MTILELNHRFPADADLDAAWSRGMSALEASVRERSNKGRPRSDR
jgi:hypothetical protein